MKARETETEGDRKGEKDGQGQRWRRGLVRGGGERRRRRERGVAGRDTLGTGFRV